MGDRKLESDTLLNLGNVYFQLDESAMAIKYRKRCSLIAQQIGDTESQTGIAVEINLGSLYQS